MPRGGTQRITDALASYLRSLGGETITGWRVQSLDELPQARVLLFDTVPRELVKICGHKFNCTDAYIRCKVAVHGRAQFPRRKLARQLDARHLRLCVHARIRPPRAMNRDRTPLQQRQHARQLALHRPLRTLHLPAMKLCAVVLERQFEVHK